MASGDMESQRSMIWAASGSVACLCLFLVGHRHDPQREISSISVESQRAPLCSAISDGRAG
jgi:hypothetical protein